MVKRRKNYLNRDDLLKEIQSSKMSYCEYEHIAYTHYDAFVADEYSEGPAFDLIKLGIDDLTPEFIIEVKEKQLRKRNYGWLTENRGVPTEQQTKFWTIDDITTESLIFRVMTYEHIPRHGRDIANVNNTPLKAKSVKKAHDPVTFPPFQHIMLNEDGSIKVVLTSHSKNGKYCNDHGRITDGLAKMYLLLSLKIGRKGNFVNYSYLDEMKGEAIVHLCMVGLQFDESRQELPNPFAYYTSVIMNRFKHYLNEEKKRRNVKDDLIEMAGMTPSFARQGQND